jgi:hypothetical protein
VHTHIYSIDIGFRLDAYGVGIMHDSTQVSTAKFRTSGRQELGDAAVCRFRVIDPLLA